MAGHAVLQNRCYNPFAQVHRIGLSHARWPPITSQHLEPENQTKRHPALKIYLYGYLDIAFFEPSSCLRLAAATPPGLVC
jgi:hypothetical protein